MLDAGLSINRIPALAGTKRGKWGFDLTGIRIWGNLGAVKEAQSELANINRGTYCIKFRGLYGNILVGIGFWRQFIINILAGGNGTLND